MKKYLRWLSVVFLIILLTGCGNKEVELLKLSDSLQKEIEAAFKAELNISNLIWYDESDPSTWAEGIRYYGTFGNVAAMYCGGVGEYGGFDDGLIFYSNGKIYPIDFAVGSVKKEEGVMTMKDIQKAADFHKTFSLTTEKKGSVFIHEGSEGVTELPAELRREVERAWWEAKNCELNWTKKRNDLRYYGNYDGTVVIYTDVSVLGNWYEIEIGGVKIGEGNFELYAYRDGELVYLTDDVYTKGWLTKEDLQTIAAYHELCEEKRWQ